jgi:hypothetical protein
MSRKRKRDRTTAQVSEDDPTPGIDTSAVPAFLLYMHL